MIAKPVGPVYPQIGHPQADDLLGAWLLTENTGTATWDASGLNNSGTLTNMVPADDWVNSPGGGALEFDGSDDYVALARTISFASSEPWSMSARIKSLEGTPTQATNIGGSNKNSINAFATNPRIFSNDLDVLISASVMVTATWYTWTAMHDGAGNYAFYIDGAEDTTASVSARGFTIDNIGNGDLNPLQGSLEWVMVHSRALTATDAAQLYDDPFAMFQPEPIWRLLPAAVGTSPYYYQQVLANRQGRF